VVALQNRIKTINLLNLKLKKNASTVKGTWILQKEIYNTTSKKLLSTNFYFIFYVLKHNLCSATLRKILILKMVHLWNFVYVSNHKTILLSLSFCTISVLFNKIQLVKEKGKEGSEVLLPPVGDKRKDFENRLYDNYPAYRLQNIEANNKILEELGLKTDNSWMVSFTLLSIL
jgi:hypothetical protein